VQAPDIAIPQTPAVHVSPAWHAVAQAPQLAGSLSRDTHAPPQQF
jgi:hypothetical protein